MGILLRIVATTGGIVAVIYAAKKLWELKDDYHYLSQDIEKYIDTH